MFDTCWNWQFNKHAHFTQQSQVCVRKVESELSSFLTQPQHHEWLKGETVWKCVSLSPFEQLLCLAPLWQHAFCPACECGHTEQHFCLPTWLDITSYELVCFKCTQNVFILKTMQILPHFICMNLAVFAAHVYSPQTANVPTQMWWVCTFCYHPLRPFHFSFCLYAFM